MTQHHMTLNNLDRLKNKKKSTNQAIKKPRTRKSSISNKTNSDACSERKENENQQTAQENSVPSKTAREDGKNGIEEEARNCRKKERSSADDKMQRKSARVKAERSQRAVTNDKETFRLPSSTHKRGWKQSDSDIANESKNQDPEQNYENKSPKTNRKNSTNGAERKKRSRSLSREKNTSNKKEEVLPSEAGGKKSPQHTRNNQNPPKQQEQRNSRNESRDTHRYDCLEKSRSPIHFDSEKNDSNTKQQTNKTRYKQSLNSNVCKKHRSNSRSRQASAMKNESEELNPEDKGYSVVRRGDSPKISHDKDSEKNLPQKQNPSEISKKPDLLGSVSENHIAYQNDSSSVESKKIGERSLKLRLQTPNLRENSSKISKRSKNERWMKRQRNGKEVVSGRQKNRKEAEADYEEQKRKETKKGQKRKETKKKSLKSARTKKS